MWIPSFFGGGKSHIIFGGSFGVHWFGSITGNIAPEKGWLQYELRFLLGAILAYFQGFKLAISFRECILPPKKKRGENHPGVSVLSVRALNNWWLVSWVLSCTALSCKALSWVSYSKALKNCWFPTVSLANLSTNPTTQLTLKPTEVRKWQTLHKSPDISGISFMTSNASKNSKLTMVHIFLFKKLEMSFKKGPKELYFYLYHCRVSL